MLSNASSSYQYELEMITQLKLGLQIVKEIINSCLSQKLKIPNVAINLSPLLNAPLFCLSDVNDPNQMTIEVFLSKCIERWCQEAQYQQEIFNLKDLIINEFEKLCNQTRDESVIEIIRKQREQVVEILFDKTNFDKKHLAADFCKGFMNGFEIEMIEKIEYYATYVVWMPFASPLPKGLIEFVKKILHEEVNEIISEATVLNASAKIIQFVENQMKEKEIEIKNGLLESSISLEQKDITPINQLKQILDTAEKCRSACSLIINEIDENNMINSNEREKIQTIIVKMNAYQFLKAKVPFTYECLELKDLEDNDNFEQAIQILQRLPKSLNNASLQFKNNKQNGVKIISKHQEQKRIYELSFNNNDISYDQMKFLACLCNILQFPLCIFISNFEYQFVEETDEEITTLTNVFTHSKAFQLLHLDFGGASIPTGSIDHLAVSISKMNQITYLGLDFCWGSNSANNNSMTLFAQAISEMPNLRHLELNFSYGKHKITDDGIAQLSQAIAKSACIQHLILYFGGEKNAVTDKGIEVLSQCIVYLERVQQLELDFHDGNHEISDKGIHALAAVLENTNNISNLFLNFAHGKSLITDASMDPLAGALKRMSSELTIVLDFRSNNNPRVTAQGESIIRNARTYKRIAFYYNG